MEPATQSYRVPAGEQRRPPTAQLRPGLVVLAALLTQIVVIAAEGNQWVTVRIARSIGNGDSDFVRGLKSALLTYNWRLTPQRFDTEHSWLSQILFIVTTLVLTALLIAAVVRGPASFLRGFFTAFMAVVVATMLAAYVRGAVNDAPVYSPSRAARAVFGPLGPAPVTFLAAIFLGVITGLIAGAAAATARQRPSADTVQPAEEPYAQPEQPPPFFGDSSGRGRGGVASTGAPTTRLGGGERTTRYPDAGDQPTTRYPDGSGGEPSPPAERGSAEAPPRSAGDAGQPTTRFPRPPDEE